MSSEDTKILEFIQNQKSDKAAFIIQADLEGIIEKIDGCKNILRTLSTTKASEHIQSSCSMSTITLFRSLEKKHDIHIKREARLCEKVL